MYNIVPVLIGHPKFVCNKTYLFSKMTVSLKIQYLQIFDKIHFISNKYIQANWTRAQEICCALNMRLLNIESYAQHKCIASLQYSSGD
jgi:hypothetical protein